MSERFLKAGLAAVVAMLAGLCPAGWAAAWSDSYVGRLQVEALVETLRADLLSNDSATEVLTRWCADHRLADPAVIVARRVQAEEASPSLDLLTLLKARPGEPVAVRHVQLVCGSRVLAVADNWYLPQRLTPQMNRALETTQTPFGAVVRPLDFQRRTLASERLFQPMPRGWESGATIAYERPRTLMIPDEILRHRALLVLPDGTPFSLVVETYRGDLFAFDPAPPR